MCGVHRRASDLLKLGLRAALCVLGTELGASARAVRALNHSHLSSLLSPLYCVSSGVQGPGREVNTLIDFAERIMCCVRTHRDMKLTLSLDQVFSFFPSYNTI